MYSNDTAQWIAVFFIYSFLGWIFESTYVSLRSHRFVNRGFLRGPILPLYGFGGLVVMLCAKPVQQSPLMIYLTGAAGATVLEYLTGIGMEKIFKVRYWDYRRRPFNIRGYICLSSTLVWGLLALFINELAANVSFSAVSLVPEEVLRIADDILIFAGACDFAISFRAALEVRDLLTRMNDAKTSLDEMLGRLKELERQLAEKHRERKEQVRTPELAEEQRRLEGLPAPERDTLRTMDLLEAHIEALRKDLAASMGAYTREQHELMDEELTSVRARLKELRGRVAGSSLLADRRKRAMFRGNPDMVSVPFERNFNELKEFFAKQHERNEKDDRRAG